MDSWGRASHESLLVYGNEVVLVTGSNDRKVVTLWRSGDGFQWSGVGLTMPGITEGAEAEVWDAATDGSKVVVLMRIVNRLDGVTVLVEQPL